MFPTTDVLLAAPPLPSLGLTLGVIEVGALISTLLYGTVIVQTYLYAINFPRDRKWIQAVVGSVFSLETLHTICVWAYLYHLTVTSFGNPVGLEGLPWFFGVTVPLQTTAGSIVQAFFAYRVQVLSGKWWLAAPAYVGQAFRAGSGIAVFILTLHDKELPIFQSRHGFVVDMSLTASAVTDLWTTALLCYYLRSRSSNYASTQNAIQRMILWTIETGIITTMLAVLIVVFLMLQPQNGIWVALNMIYPKLYPNSLLVSLNARTRLRDDVAGVQLTQTYEVSVQPAHSGSGGGSGRMGRTPDVELTSVLPLGVSQAGSKRGYPFEDYK